MGRQPGVLTEMWRNVRARVMSVTDELVIARGPGSLPDRSPAIERVGPDRVC